MSDRSMTTAEMEAMARKIIADLVAEGEAGRLDGAVFEALKAGLARRQAAAVRNRKLD